MNGIDHALGLASKLIAEGKLFEGGEMLQKASEGIASLGDGPKRDELIRHYQLVKHAGNFRQTMRTLTDGLGLGAAAGPFASVREQRRMDLGHMLFDELRHALELLDQVGDPINGADQSILHCMPLVLELGYENPSCGKCGKPWSQHLWPTERHYLTACPTVTAVHAHTWQEVSRLSSPERLVSRQHCACGEERELDVTNDADGRALLEDP